MSRHNYNTIKTGKCKQEVKLGVTAQFFRLFRPSVHLSLSLSFASFTPLQKIRWMDGMYKGKMNWGLRLIQMTCSSSHVSTLRLRIKKKFALALKLIEQKSEKKKAEKVCWRS